MNRRQYIVPAVAVLVAVFLAGTLVGGIGGLFFGGHPNSLPGPLRDLFVEDDRAVQAELEEEIQDNFYKEVPEDKLEQGALDGMVRSLGDRFSAYISPDEAQAFQQSVSGEFEGVGMSVEQHNRGLLILQVFEGSPAFDAGIRKGDVVSKVNGESIAGQPTQVATGKIKGKAGTKVTLTVLRAGKPEQSKDYELERERIEIPVVEASKERRGGQEYGVVKLLGFSRGAHGELRSEIDKLLEGGVDGLVLDLRGNGGGLLTEAVLVSSIFIEDGRIVSTKGRKKSERVFPAEGDAIDGDVPLVVLVDKGSASASEIVTGALRDRKRATVVGQRTFGKGVFQEVNELSNGGLLDLTVGSYFLPGGENISDKGIKPQVEAVDKPDTRRDEALPKALAALARADK